jgi:hypothetical protein
MVKIIVWMWRKWIDGQIAGLRMKKKVRIWWIRRRWTHGSKKKILEEPRKVPSKV